MKYDDLSIYEISEEPEKNGPLYCVGWIGRGENMPVGETPDLFLDKFYELCYSNIFETYRSATPCLICFPSMKEMREAMFDGSGIDKYASHSEKNKKILLGSSVLLIKGEAENYICPDLLWHYVSDHNYKPPQKFIDIVLDA